MESPRKFNDCYFYFYSTCIKGDNCVFRHEPSALGCETMCTAWQQGKCLDKRCKLRHMELRKNRKQIPCYWENQPGGCRKIHCPFMHKNPDARTDGIAPSQPGPPQAAHSGASSAGPVPPAEGEVLAAPAAPVPLLWQQRQGPPNYMQSPVVLDSAILGVLPGGELARRVPHAHEPYAPMAQDPLVVNFEEESDNESAPSSTPTKCISAEKSQELQRLEQIQAQAAAFYEYEAPPPGPRRRLNLHYTKYDRLSLDEISPAGNKYSNGMRASLDFKVLSLDEIRARKKSETVIHNTPIALNLCKKRKQSTQETITTSGNKMIKVVRSNSVVYKKITTVATVTATQPKPSVKPNEDKNCRKRTMSEQNIYEIQDDELVDNCHDFKRIKVSEHTSKPRLIRNRQNENEVKHSAADSTSKSDNDSDPEVQIVSVEINKRIDLDSQSESDTVDVETGTEIGSPVNIVDLSDDSVEMSVSNIDLNLDVTEIVPDVVSSCNDVVVGDAKDKDLLANIDAILDKDL